MVCRVAEYGYYWDGDGASMGDSNVFLIKKRWWKTLTGSTLHIYGSPWVGCRVAWISFKKVSSVLKIKNPSLSTLIFSFFTTKQRLFYEETIRYINTISVLVGNIIDDKFRRFPRGEHGGKHHFFHS